MSVIRYEGEDLDIKKMPTRQLLKFYRRINGGPYCECCHSPEFLEEKAKIRRMFNHILEEELSKREHIPNKIEAKEIRKQKMKEKKNLKNRKTVKR